MKLGTTFTDGGDDSPGRRTEQKQAHPRTYQGVQALRGLAASMVVLFHASENWSLFARGDDAHAWQNGAAGVEIFFVISGFVMAVSSLGKGDGPRAAWSFLERRLVRILPLYWLVTTLLLLKISSGFVYSPYGLRHVPLPYAVCSYLLLPCRAPNGVVGPLLAPGWTLTFEMFFYLCFAGVLWMRKSVPWILTVVFLLLTLIGRIPFSHPAAAVVLLSPLLLDFLGGLWLGRMASAGHVLSPRLAGALGLAALALLWFGPTPRTEMLLRLDWGVCGLLAVQAAIALETHIAGRLPGSVLLLGDASYSIYLVHAPLLGLCTDLLRSAGVLIYGRVRARDEALTMGFCLLVSIAAGVLTYKVAELPLNNLLRRRLHIRRRVQIQSGEEASST